MTLIGKPKGAFDITPPEATTPAADARRTRRRNAINAPDALPPTKLDFDGGKGKRGKSVARGPGGRDADSEKAQSKRGGAAGGHEGFKTQNKDTGVGGYDDAKEKEGKLVEEEENKMEKDDDQEKDEGNGGEKEEDGEEDNEGGGDDQGDGDDLASSSPSRGRKCAPNDANTASGGQVHKMGRRSGSHTELQPPPRSKRRRGSRSPSGGRGSSQALTQGAKMGRSGRTSDSGERMNLRMRR